MTARVLAFAVLAGAALQAQVTFDRILQADKEPQNWLSYSGTLFNQRHSQLTQITPANAKNPQLQWVWQATLTPNFNKPEDGFGVIRALDVQTLEKKWDFPMNDITWGGVLTTATDVLFSGGKEGYFFALDARNGALLWRVTLGGKINSGPMTYAVNGRQYVAAGL